VPTGHRGNLKAQAPRFDATDKDKPKQVNFGQGSALAAFALKNSKGKEKEQQAVFSPSTPLAARQQPSSVQKKPLKPLGRRNTRASAAPKKIVDIPATVSVNALSQILSMKLRESYAWLVQLVMICRVRTRLIRLFLVPTGRLQFMMEKMGISDTRADKRKRLIP